jgi:hypothetical protein
MNLANSDERLSQRLFLMVVAGAVVFLAATGLLMAVMR